MSIRLMSTVWDTPLELDPTCRLVLLSLADQANDEGLCWPSVATVARRCGVSPKSARRWLHYLEERGWLRREEKSGTSNRYWLTPPTGDTPPVDGTPPTHGRGTPPTGDRAPLPPTGAEPSENHQMEPSPSPPPSGRGAVDALPGMPEEQPTRTAGDLVRSWVDAYTLARGSAPLASQVKRTASSARRLADDLEPLGDAAWAAGLELARLAGRDGYMDLIAAIPRYHRVQPSSPTAWWVQAARNNGEGIEA